MANVKVAVRVRPICKREEDAKATIVVNEYQENVLGVANPKIEGIEGCSDHRDRIKHFSFDYCYFSLDKSAPNYASQQTL
ncbi:kinesin-like protein KIF16B isoform X2 [Lytechinus variegatus]|nr:kinesin-like protein KIF16B isoform X2 [Lytechinus variegatus]XP_054759850.1 kinesin-like protein KIF16B isoform X2 [Lytechinus pictus]